ncbi:unnamed protein product [Amoebophrya sp. A120]|nr:unnamed protein product [Amoebophrya sp. A120]|eukprot:GSA120T00023122001.1
MLRRRVCLPNRPLSTTQSKSDCGAHDELRFSSKMSEEMRFECRLAGLTAILSDDDLVHARDLLCLLESDYRRHGRRPKNVSIFTPCQTSLCGVDLTLLNKQGAARRCRSPTWPGP